MQIKKLGRKSFLDALVEAQRRLVCPFHRANASTYAARMWKWENGCCIFCMILVDTNKTLTVGRLCCKSHFKMAILNSLSDLSKVQ